MNKKLKSGLLVASFILGLFVILYFTGVIGQSVLNAPATAQVSDGRLVWITLIQANQIKSTGDVGFYVTGASYTLSEQVGNLLKGTQVVPKDSVMMYFSQRENFCSYQLIKVTKTNPNLLAGLTKFKTISYYQLHAPERTFLVDVCANSDCKTLDASAIINGDTGRASFTVNGGDIVVESMGAFTGKRDCSNNQNVALYLDANGNQYWLSENDLLAQFYSITDLFNPTRYGTMDAFIIDKVIKNTAFSDNFKNGVSVNSDRSSVKGSFGTDVLFGAGIFRVVADAKVFNSAFIVARSTCSPSVSLSSPPNIVEDSSGTVKMTVKSDGACDVSYSTSISRGTVSPTSGSLGFTGVDSKSKSLTIKASSNSGAWKLTATVCSSDEFSNKQVCDSDSVEGNYIQKQDLKPSDLVCGDGTCSASIGEDSSNCPNDCTSVAPPVTPPSGLICKDKFGGLISGSPVTTESCGLWCKWGLSEPTLKNTCSYNYMPLLFVLLALSVFGVATYFVVRKNKGGRK